MAGSHDDAIARVMVQHVRTGLALWVETFGRILTKAGDIITPKLNPMQQDVVDAVAWCLENDKPIRLIILKPRQKGCSTISIAVMYWLMCRYVINAVLIGGQYDQVDNLWKIFRRYAESDGFEWGFDRNVMERSARFGNGSALARETAGDEEAGRAGTFQFMLATEAARWNKANAADVLAGIMNCIPYLPRTCVILESTARGPTGFFYDYWQDAVEIEDFKRGEEGNGFIRIFSPWFAHDDSCDDVDPGEESRLLINSYTQEEQAMVTKFNLSPGHIQYYRRTMRTECKKDPAVMMREYPGTPEEAFHASSNQRFNTVGLKLMRSRAMLRAPQFGLLDGEDRTYSWIPTDENEGFLQVLDHPIEGLRYCIPVDVMTGGSQVEGADPDKHSALVLRSAYRDVDGRYWPPKVVARTIPKCRWEIDVLAEWVWRMSHYYGNCTIIPETNMDRGLTLLLNQRGANLMRQMSGDNRGDVRLPKKTDKLGFNTRGGSKAGSREWIISNLAAHIREFENDMPGIEADIHTIDELCSFVTDPITGRAEAATGKHDDDVMALAIGLACEARGTVYRPKVDVASIPRDLREDFAVGRRRGSRGRGKAKGRFS